MNIYKKFGRVTFYCGNYHVYRNFGVSVTRTSKYDEAGNIVYSNSFVLALWWLAISIDIEA